MATTTCPNCDTEFTYQPAGGHPRTYCTDACRYKWRDRTRWTPRGTPVSKRCVDCDTEFTYISATAPRKRCDACRPGGGRANA